jgi:large subunit ribosomal protein L14e
MFDIGRVCMKIAGRDAGMKCVIVDIIDEHYVMIDGQTRRRKCNIKHLEPLAQTVQITKNAPVPEVVRALKELSIIVEEEKPKVKAAAAKNKAERTGRPKRQRKRKEKPVKETKAKPAKEIKKKTMEKSEKLPEKKSGTSEKKE